MPEPSLIKIKFKHLLNPGVDEFEEGELFIEGGKITKISEGYTDSFEGETIDLSDCLILPGFVNAHCHLSLSALAGKTRPVDSFTDWIRSVVSLNAKLPWKERVEAAHKSAGEMLRSGVTAVADYLSHPELLADYATLPFRQVVFLETIGFKSSDASSIIEPIESILAEHATSSSDRIRLGLAPHAPYSVSPALFRELGKLSERYKCPMSCHVAEVEEEARFLREGGGEFERLLRDRGVLEASWSPPKKSPVRYLDDLGILDSLLAVHLNYAEDDLGLLVERTASAAFCPGSTRWFGRKQWMPVRRFLDLGAAVGLGTDSLASNDSINFFNELRMAEAMLADVGREEILAMATSGGARALNLPGGRLAPGRSADLLALRVDSPPSRWADIPFEGYRREADWVMIDGKTVHSKHSAGGDLN